MLRHTLQSGHPSLSLNKFKILGKDFEIRVKRRISEALLIKENRSSLHAQKNSKALELFNRLLRTLYE